MILKYILNKIFIRVVIRSILDQKTYVLTIGEDAK